MSVLQVNGLKKEFIDKTIFEDVNFHIEEGEKIGLIGQNGQGKTTLLEILSNNMGYDEGSISYQRGFEPAYLKQHTTIESDLSIHDEAISVFEDVFKLEEKIKNLELEISNLTEDNFENSSILDEYSKAIEKFQEIEGASVNSRVIGVLKGLGFSEDEFEKPISTLSGGQKSRVNLAKLLLRSPNFIFLDEPTNHLDIESISWLEGFLKDYKGTFIVVSHDRYFLDNIVNRILVIENKKLYSYKGDYSTFIKKYEKDREVRQKQYENRKAEIEREKEIVDRFLSVGREKLIRQGQSRLKRLEKLEPLDPVYIKNNAKIKFETNKKAGREIFIAEDLSKSFNDKKIFENISFMAFNGDRVGIIGPNGVGKSTLFKIINGEIYPDTGDIKIGTNVDIGYFDQEMRSLSLDKTIIEEIWDEYPLLTHFEIRSYLAKMMFVDDDILKEIKSLSGGEKARVAILKLMLSDSNVLLLDEPTNHLDIDSKEILEKALKDYNGTVIAISHDRYFLNNFADKIWELKSDGLTEYLGDYSYYKMKKDELKNRHEEVDEITKTEKNALRKEERKRINENKKLRLEREKLEKEIEELESKIEEIDLILSSGTVVDYEEILEITKEREMFSESLELTYEKWMELS